MDIEQLKLILGALEGTADSAVWVLLAMFGTRIIVTVGVVFTLAFFIWRGLVAILAHDRLKDERLEKRRADQDRREANLRAIRTAAIPGEVGQVTETELRIIYSLIAKGQAAEEDK